MHRIICYKYIIYKYTFIIHTHTQKHIHNVYLYIHTDTHIYTQYFGGGLCLIYFKCLNLIHEAKTPAAQREGGRMKERQSKHNMKKNDTQSAQSGRDDAQGKCTHPDPLDGSRDGISLSCIWLCKPGVSEMQNGISMVLL